MNKPTRRSRLVAAIVIAGIFLVLLVATPWVVIKYFLNSDANKTVIVEVANKPVAAAVPAPTPVPGAPARAVAVPGAPAAAANGSNIGGVVQNEHGIPVAAVRIIAMWPPGPSGQGRWGSQRTVSDASGHWTISGPTKDLLPRLHINVQSRDYVSGDIQIVPKPDDLLAHSAVLVLSQGINITGVVVDEHGEPLAGAVIRGGDQFGNNARNTRSSAAGKFTLRHVKPGNLTILTTAAGHAPDLRQLTANAAPPPLKIAMEPSKPMRGQVVAVDYKPIAGVTVYFENWRDTRLLRWQGTTDGEGRFAMPDAPSDSFSMSFDKQGYQGTYQDGLLAGTDALITMHGSLHVSGTVVDGQTGNPIPSFTIVQGIKFLGQPQIYWQPNMNQNKAVSPGKFEFDEDQNYAGYAVRIEAPGYYAADSRVFTADEGRVTLALKMNRGKDLQVSILDPDGKPAAGALGLLAMVGRQVNIRNSAEMVNQNEGNDQAVAGADGKIRFPPENQAFKLVALDDKGYAEVDSAKLSESEPVRLIAWGRIEGRLMIGASPGANQQVAVTVDSNRVYRPDAIMIFHQINPMTDALGNFVAEQVPAGEVSVYRVILRGAPGGGEYWQQAQTQILTIAPGQTAHITVGGKGRAVVGKIDLPAELASRHDWIFGMPSQAVSQEMAYSPDAKLAVKNWLNDMLGKGPPPKPPMVYPLEIKDDNTFRIDDVVRGNYQITLRIGTGRWGEQTLATGILNFMVAPMPGGRSDEPLELPPVEMKMASN
jgi:Carboxypeptidase regulatory-like domain